LRNKEKKIPQVDWKLFQESGLEIAWPEMEKEPGSTVAMEDRGMNSVFASSRTKL